MSPPIPAPAVRRRVSPLACSLVGAGLLVAGVLVIAGCGEKSPASGPGSGTAGDSRPAAPEPPPGAETVPNKRSVVKLREVSSQPVAASGKDQTLRVDDTLSVTVPGETLKSASTLAVSVPAEAQPVIAPQFERIGDYDISLGAESKFAKDLTLSMKYDAKKLDPGLRADFQLVAACWNADREQWQRVPFTLDEKSGTMNVRTRHLSRWAAWYQVVRGFKVHEVFWSDKSGGFWSDSSMGTLWDGDTVWFRVFYNPEKDPPMAMTPSGKDKQRPVSPSLLVLGTLQRAFEKYRDAGFLVPTGTFDVFIDSKMAGAAETDSSFYGIDNIIFLPDPMSWENGEEPRQLVAHELFHTVQNRYLNAPLSMTLRKWWMEATADYAAARIAWDDTPSIWDYTIRFVKTWYPEQSFTYFKDVDAGVKGSAKEADDAATAVDPFQKHQYHTCVFLDFLIQDDKDHKKFQKLWTASTKAWVLSAYSTAVEDAIDAHLRSLEGSAKYGLRERWESFVINWYFQDGLQEYHAGCVSPQREKGKMPEPRKPNRYELPEGQDSLSVQMAVNGRYGVCFARVTTNAEEGGEFWIPGNVVPEGCDLFAVAYDWRPPGLGFLDDHLVEREESIFRTVEAHGGQTAHVSKGTPLFLLAINRGPSALFNVQIQKIDWELSPERVEIVEGESASFAVKDRFIPPNVKFTWDFNDGDGGRFETQDGRASHVYQEWGLFERDVRCKMSDATTGEFYEERHATVVVKRKPAPDK